MPLTVVEIVRSPRHCSRWLALTTITVFLLLAATIAQATETLRIPFSSDISTLDPDNGFEVAGLSVLDSLYEGLVEYEPGSTRIVGLLATSWVVSKDGLTYTFRLREGVKFHDGTLMDASAVVTSLDRRRLGKLLQNYTLANVRAINALDASTVVISLSKPQPSFLDTLASPWGPKVISPTPLNEHDKGDGATDWLTDHAVGTGPFTLGEFKRGERYSIDRNANYWGHKPYFSKVEFPVVPDIGQQILKLRAGEIDAIPTNYPFAQLASLPDNLEITTAPSMTQFDAFEKPGSELDNLAVRKAVLTAVNPALWADDAFGHYAHVSQSLYPNAMFVPARPLIFPTDMEAAKDAIAKRGPVALRIGLYSANPSYGRIADLLIAQLATIGVQATSYVMPPGSAYAMKGDPSAPDLLLIIASPDAAHPDNQAKAFLTTGAPLNLYGRKVPEADAIVDEASTLTELCRRDELYEKAARMYFDNGTAIPLVDVDDVVVHVKGLKNLGLRPVFPRGTIDFATVER
ncbi:ABC transporter substrate-binding protein [Rhizobium sp. GCM10022189]|uniref:ABC transporter substrate-binding protein n=1 Tax=Rhizobium sp. GCM10022189 TaxID=3252654 RepID=UPI00360CF82D